MKGIGKVAGIVAGVFVGYLARKHIERIERIEDHIMAMQWDNDISFPIDEEDVTRKYPPSLVWVCDECESLMTFHDSPENMQAHIDEVKDCDVLYCPECGEPNEVDPVTRHIMNQDWMERH